MGASYTERIKNDAALHSLIFAVLTRFQLSGSSKKYNQDALW